jgi:hypothetical protein
MNEHKREQQDQITEFTEKTRKEVHIWDWLGRILPLTALFALSIFHYADLHSLRDLVLGISLVVFVTICFVWWYWALRKIISSVKYIQQAHQKFADLTDELRQLRKNLRKNDSDR